MFCAPFPYFGSVKISLENIINLLYINYMSCNVLYSYIIDSIFAIFIYSILPFVGCVYKLKCQPLENILVIQTKYVPAFVRTHISSILNLSSIGLVVC